LKLNHICGDVNKIEDTEKPKQQLIIELAELRQRIAELEKPEKGRKRADEEMKRLNRDLSTLYTIDFAANSRTVTPSTESMTIIDFFESFWAVAILISPNFHSNDGLSMFLNDASSTSSVSFHITLSQPMETEDSGFSGFS